MRDINLAPFRSRKRSSRSFLLIGLFSVVFGSLVLMVVFFMKPEVKRPQLVGERIRLPIKSIEKDEEHRIPGFVEQERVVQRSLEGAILEEEKPIASEVSEPSIMAEEKEEGNKKLFIVDEKEVPEGEKELRVAEGEVKGPEIEGKEEEKTQVAMGEESKGLPIPEGKLLTGGYTVNIASFKDKGNADRLMNDLRGRGYEAFLEKADIAQKGTWYRVAVGRFSSRAEALAFAQGLEEKGINYSFVRKLKEGKQ